MAKNDDVISYFLTGVIVGAFVSIVLIMTILLSSNNATWNEGEAVVNVPEFGAALCGGMGLGYDGYTNDPVLKISCIENNTLTQPLIDGVVTVTRQPSTKLQVKNDQVCIVYNSSDRTTYYYGADHKECQQ